MLSPQPYDLGYTFFPARHPHDPGHPRLDIIIRPEPTGLHFDPERVQIPVVQQEENFENLLVTHPWARAENLELFPGRVILRDRLNKVAEAFVFGGQVEINSDEEKTRLSLRSPAPILSLTIERSVAVLLAEEVEILLAERRAAWAGNLHEYEHRLARTDPLSLYHACLNSLREKFRHFPPAEDGQNQRFYHFLVVESRVIQETHHLPVSGDTVEELL